MTPSITVLGNLAADRVDGGAPRPGGCPAFAPAAFRLAGAEGRVVTRCAVTDRALFAGVLAGADAIVLESESTTAFDIRLTGEDRSMSVRAIGDAWRVDDLEHAVLAPWVHAAPLLRDEIPSAVLREIARAGSRVAFDGQGLVRARLVGPLRLDARFDPELLRWVDVLKLAEEEAAIVGGGSFGPADADVLDVPEVLVTLGSRGTRIYAGGRVEVVTAPAVPGSPDTTGAGDTFLVAYVAARAAGAEPVEAGRRGSEVAAAALAERGGAR